MQIVLGVLLAEHGAAIGVDKYRHFAAIVVHHKLCAAGGGGRR